MRAIIEPSTISGTVHAPPSKSLSQRAIAAAFLHRGTTALTGIGESDDELAALSVIKSFGADVRQNGFETVITSTGAISPDCLEINCGESGLAARLFTPIAATASHPIRVCGSGTLHARSMDSLFAALRALGVQCSAKSERLPVIVQGPMIPSDITLDGSGSSQVLSGILFALSSIADRPLTIKVTSLTSQPYIDLTLDVLREFGAVISHSGYNVFSIPPESTRTPPEYRSYHVEGDWSNAAFWIVASMICNVPLTVTNLKADSLQGDREILAHLRNAGAIFNWSADGTLHLSEVSEGIAFQADLSNTPDLFPVLCILAAQVQGESRLEGIHRLPGKESNRIVSICSMLDVLRVSYQIAENCFFISGDARFKSGTISAFKDHRIVTAAAIAALVAAGPVPISGAEAVTKSYPAFFPDMQSLGARLRLNPDL